MRNSTIPSLGAALPLALLAATLCAAADPVVTTQRVRAHTTFLADDLLEGRAVGTRGYDLAARYVASQFARIGLEPGADQADYLQPMKFIEATNQLEAGRLVVQHGGTRDELAPINDMIALANLSRTSDAVTAPAVFVGYGVHAPELGYDDYAGVDLRGKIAVVLSGSPATFPGTQRAHHSAGNQKRALAVQHGAVGLIAIMTPADEARHPWAMVVAQSRFSAMRLLDATGAVVDGFPELRVFGTISRTAAARLFVASGHTSDEIFARATRGEAQSFPLNAELTVAGENTQRPVGSANVLGWLPGTDPALADQPVVVTGHLDHLGLAAPGSADRVYNGAIDNAVGIAVILAAAEELATGPRPARPILFAALTGEEKGLLGAYHLARNPPARVRQYAANLNLDMPLFPVPVRSLIAWGAEHSTLGALTTAVAAKAGFTVTPDPMPEETIFVRSDQYAFVQAGVPALFLSSGQQAVDPATDLAGLWHTHLRERYHKPSDDLQQPIDWPSAGAFAGLAADVLREIANDPQAPAWLPGDFFGGLYGR